MDCSGVIGVLLCFLAGVTVPVCVADGFAPGWERGDGTHRFAEFFAVVGGGDCPADVIEFPYARAGRVK